MSEAREQFLKALEINPNALGCYSNLADLEKFTPDNPISQAMEAIIGRSRRSCQPIATSRSISRSARPMTISANTPRR